MSNKNVCKFPLIVDSNDLTVYCFVLETNPDAMKNQGRLANDRAILVEQGNGSFLFGKTSVPFSAGSLIFGFEGEFFSIENGENVSYFYIDFNGSKGKNLLQRFNVFPSNRIHKNFSELVPFVKESLLRSTQENIDITTESVLLYLFSRLTPCNPKENALFQNIINYTNENFSNSELSISVIGQEFGYNPKYLSHFFKSRMNLTYSEYLRSLRFKYAISLFENGLSSIKNVAFLSGFSDPLYFSSTFKKELGVSPKEFIARINKK